MGQQNIIELNGKRYDAITGAVLGPATTPVTAAPRRVIDGFIRSSKIAQPVPATSVIRPSEAPTAAISSAQQTHGKKMDVTRPTASQLRRHQPQKGQTLMRRAVSKPTLAMKPKVKVQAPSELAPASVKTIARPLTKKLSVAKVDKRRLDRARSVARSSNIRRFQPARTVSAALQPAARPAINAQSQAPQQPHHTAQRPAAAALRAQPDIFEAAIARARSHEQPAPRIRSRHARTVSILAGIGAFLVMGGFLAYLNMPGIEMRFASMKVGFSAQLPSYKPTGYALDNGVKTDGKRVSVSFRSGDSAYTVVQQASDWNSQTLLDNYVTLNAASHQTIQSQGRTIYIWDGHKAAWVDGGVRYEITGNAPLTADDIVKLATSI